MYVCMDGWMDVYIYQTHTHTHAYTMLKTHTHTPQRHAIHMDCAQVYQMGDQGIRQSMKAILEAELTFNPYPFELASTR
jgi:hypothetical protein